jgi:hypothetical protein
LRPSGVEIELTLTNMFHHDGEGQYEQMDRTIARLLNASS